MSERARSRQEPGPPDVPTIAVDVLGGDRAPQAVIDATRAAVESGQRVLLVGPPDVLDDIEPHEGLTFATSAAEAVHDGEDPLKALRRLPDASVAVCCRAVKDGRADAIVSAGATGATVGAASLGLGRLRGVRRVAIATVVPSLQGANPTVLLDTGANADCKPVWFVTFARLGVAYARSALGIETPRVGLLNIGAEHGKGNETCRDAYELLARAGVNFVGNVEGGDLFDGPADVIVTDGFTGNVALKVAEGTASAVARLAGAELPAGGGGSLLLGIDGVCVVAHGASRSTAISAAIASAATAVRGRTVASLARALADGKAQEKAVRRAG